jgi:myosin heavy subunit
VRRGRPEQSKFTVVHYAAHVTYDSHGFVEKNKVRR